MSVVVLGAGGFIGSHVAQALIDRGEEVMVVSSREPTTDDRRSVWEAAATRCLADLRTETIDLLGSETVFNFAADMGGVGYFSNAQIGPYITNSRITFNVLEMSGTQRINQLFMASSACAYPTNLQQDRDFAPLLSESQLEHGPPDQMYGREKLMVCALATQADFDCRVGILHTVYGDSTASSVDKMKFPTAVALKALKARETGHMSIWGDGSQLRSYLWIDDAVAKILRVMEGPNPGPINIGRQGAISVEQVVAICNSHLGQTPQINYDSSAPSGVASRDCSNALFWSLYGNMEPTDYGEGFGMLIDELQSHLDQ